MIAESVFVKEGERRVMHVTEIPFGVDGMLLKFKINFHVTERKDGAVIVECLGLRGLSLTGTNEHDLLIQARDEAVKIIGEMMLAGEPLPIGDC